MTENARHPGAAAFPPIYLVRHGQTSWNREGRLQGQRDAPLTQLGTEHARAAGRRLRDELGSADDFRIFSSPLGRCRQTLDLIVEVTEWSHPEPTFDERLMEIAFGRWEGLSVADIQQCDGVEWAARAADKWHYVAPGGESYQDVAVRIKEWLGEQQGETPVVIVCHGAAGAVLRGLYLGLQPAQIMTLDKPQGVVFRLRGGREEKLQGVGLAGAHS
jgi:broad specificity phosphatase PhoE